MEPSPALRAVSRSPLAGCQIGCTRYATRRSALEGRCLRSEGPFGDACWTSVSRRMKSERGGDRPSPSLARTILRALLRDADGGAVAGVGDREGAGGGGAVAVRAPAGRTRGDRGHEGPCALPLG